MSDFDYGDRVLLVEPDSDEKRAGVVVGPDVAEYVEVYEGTLEEFEASPHSPTVWAHESDLEEA